MIEVTRVDTHVTGGPRPGTHVVHAVGLVADADSGFPLYVELLPPEVRETPPWPGPELTLGPE